MYRLILILMLTGCNSGFEVREYETQKNCTYVTSYKCIERKPLFQYDIDMAICDTLKECQKKCDDYRYWGVEKN